MSKGLRSSLGVVSSYFKRVSGDTFTVCDWAAPFLYLSQRRSSMSYKFNCPHCNQKLEADDSLQSENVGCPSCEKIITILPNKNTAPPTKKKYFKSIISCISVISLTVFRLIKKCLKIAGKYIAIIWKKTLPIVSKSIKLSTHVIKKSLKIAGRYIVIIWEKTLPIVSKSIKLSTHVIKKSFKSKKICISAISLAFIIATTLVIMFSTQGDVETQYQLALSYEKGEDTVKDEAKAFNCYLKAANLGHAKAQMAVGNCYLNGSGAPASKTTAAKWYIKAAEQGLLKAQNMVIAMYTLGKGVTKSHKKALKWSHKAAAQGDLFALVGIASHYRWGRGVTKNQREAVKWYCKAVQKGNPLAKNILSRVGSEYKAILGENVEWYRAVAEQGYPKAQKALGDCYRLGKGVPINKKEAMKWYRKAAKQGNSSAKSFLSDLEKEDSKAPEKTDNILSKTMARFRTSAEAGDTKAQTVIGIYYITGDNNHREAVKWLYKAAVKGNDTAQCYLGACYALGKGVTKDEYEAAKWLRKSARQGNVVAQKLLRQQGIKY